MKALAALSLAIALAVSAVASSPPSTQASQARGVIKAVDLDDGSLVVVDEKCVSARFAVTRNTKVRVGNQDGTLADLRVGDPVGVVYERHRDRNVALLVGRP